VARGGLGRVERLALLARLLLAAGGAGLLGAARAALRFGAGGGGVVLERVARPLAWSWVRQG